MERNSDETKKSDAQILAQMRRRSSNVRSGQDQDQPRGELSSSQSELDDPRSSAERAEALKRLAASRRAPKEPMSSLSPALRDLREELISGSTAFGVEPSDRDASLELLESELESESASNGFDALDADDEKKKRGAGTLSFSRLVRAEPSSVLSSSDAPRVDLVETASDASKSAKEKRTNGHDDLLVVSDLRKGYVKGKKLIPVLQGIDLTARQGELLAVVGQSGSGKSTLLHLMATLDIPDSGTIHFDGQRIDNLPSAQRDVLRNRYIGMIFQFYHLIPEMTTLENVLAPLMIRDSIWGYLRSRAAHIERAKRMLDLVGLSHRLKHRPNELSGGEMQRVSIARALIAEPRVLLADEPTGNLDSKASIEILKLLRKLNDEQGLTIVMVTHDMSQASDADRAIRLVDGRVVAEETLRQKNG